eukprot:TRINITY_DN12853_c0_g1_i1.p1 TRINITY_DN12853_c0_g1~~TRINITY_DN12853_c0_g1_i1.p1  ORF type:complete len:485 (+),score=223.41 TRINITY_DN12853_c0_g1_i1:73-1455(+)
MSVARRGPHFPECPTPEAKTRCIFDDLRGSNGCIGSVEWQSGFQKLNVPFSGATADDLFQKADTNHDGVVAFGEFQSFADGYPTLIDCMYYRAKDWWAERAQRDAIAAAQAAHQQMQDGEDRARAAHQQSQQQTDDAERGARAAEQELVEAEGQEGQAREALSAAHADSERQRRVLADAGQEVHRAREAERQVQAAMQGAQRAKERAERGAEQQQQAVSKAEERLSELERMVELQREEVARQRHGLDAAVRGVEEADGQVSDLSSRLADSSAAVTAAQDQHRAQEGVLQNLSQAEVQAAQGLRERQAVSEQHRTRLGQMHRTFEQAKLAEQQRQREAEESGLQAQQQLAAIAAQEADNAAFRERRLAIDEDEKMMLEQEVRLREERLCLEQKETKLRTDFYAFTRAPVTEPPLQVSPARPAAAPAYVAATPPLSVSRHTAAPAGYGSPGYRGYPVYTTTA